MVHLTAIFANAVTFPIEFSKSRRAVTAAVVIFVDSPRLVFVMGTEVRTVLEGSPGLLRVLFTKVTDNCRVFSAVV